MVTCLDQADLLTLLFVMFSCVFVTFPYGILGQVTQSWYLIASVPDICLLPYFYFSQKREDIIKTTINESAGIEVKPVLSGHSI